jgi:hypothetical protein
VKVSEQTQFSSERKKVDWEGPEIWPAGRGAHCPWDRWGDSDEHLKALLVERQVLVAESRWVVSASEEPALTLARLWRPLRKASL